MNHICYFYPKSNIDDNLNFLNDIPLEYKNENSYLYWLTFILSNLENINKFNNSILYTNDQGKKIIELFAIPYSNIKIINHNNFNELNHTYNLLEIFLEQNSPFIFTNKNTFFINKIPKNINNFSIGTFTETVPERDKIKLKLLIDSMKTFYGKDSDFLTNYNYTNINSTLDCLIINDINLIKNYCLEMLNLIKNNIDNINMQFIMSKKIIRMKNLTNYFNYAIINNFLINYYISKNIDCFDMIQYNKNPLTEYYIQKNKFNPEFILEQILTRKYPEHMDLLENYRNI